MSGVEIRVRANTKEARRDIGSLERSVKSLDNTAQKVTRGFRNLAAGITAAFATNAAIRSVNQASDAIVNLENRIALVVGRGAELDAVLGKLYGLAARSRLPVNTAADTFNRFGLALQGTGKSANQLLTVTEAVAQSAAISGATAQSAEAAIIQLGQGLASGELRGQELNSVLEQMPRLARAIADGMGVPFGKLRELAKDGELDAETVFQAIIDQASSIDNEFKTLDATVGQLTNVLRDEFTRALGAIDREFGFSESFKEQIIIMTNALRSFADNFEVTLDLIGGRFTLFSVRVGRFAREVKKTITGLFDVPLSYETLTSAFTEINDSLQANLGGVLAPIKIKIEKIDLSEFIPSIDDVAATLSAWKEKIIGFFAKIKKMVVGNSYWADVFWKGADRIGGPKFAKAIDDVRGTLELWTWDITDFFSNLYDNVTELWTNLIDYLSTKKIETPDGEQEVLTRFGRIAEYASKAGGKFVIDISQNARELISLDKTISSGEAILTERTALGKLVDLIGSGLNYIEVKFSDNFETILDRLVGALKTAGTLIAAQASPVTRFVSGTADTAEEYIEGGKIAADSFIQRLSDSQAQIAAALVVGFVAAAKVGFKKVAVTIASVILAPEALNSKAFQASVEEVAQGIGEIIAGLFTGEGDYGAELVQGIADTLNAAGSGLIRGLFGSEFEDELANTFAGALAAALATVLIVGKLRTELFKLGAKVAGGIVAGKFATEFASGLVLALTNGLAMPLLIGNSAKWRAKAFGLGVSIGTQIQRGVIVGLTVGLAVAIGNAIKDMAPKLKDVVRRAVTGKTIEEDQTEQSQKILETARQDPAFAKEMIRTGEISAKELSRLSADELGELRGLLEPVTDAWYDKVNSFFNVFDGGESVLDRVLGKLDEAADIQLKLAQERDIFTYGEFGGVGMATGGVVRGPGTGTSDDIPAMLSNGEYVIKASAVKKYGTNFLNMLNSGGVLKQFSPGGYVSPYDDMILETSREIKTSMELNDRIGVIKLERLLDKLYADRRAYINRNYDVVDLDKAVGEVPNAGDGGGDDDKKTPKTSGQEFATSFASDFRNGLTQALRTGEFKEFGEILLDSFTMNIIDSFSKGLTESLFKGLIGNDGTDGPLASIFTGVEGWAGSLAKNTGTKIKEGLEKALPVSGQGGFFGNIFNSLLGLSGGGGLFSSLFGMSFGSFLGFSGPLFANSGGIVPSTPYSKAGVDSVPAMLTPGELIVPADRVKDFTKSNNNSTVVNLSITGDVSRQTRQEIVKMLPTIASGVNAQNKERNYKYR